MVLGIVGTAAAHLLLAEYATSIVKGLGIFIVANAYFVLRVFRHTGADSVIKVAASFSQGLMGKLFIVSGLFAATFIWGVEIDQSLRQADQIAALFVSFIVAQLVFVVMAAVWSARKQDLNQYK